MTPAEALAVRKRPTDNRNHFGIELEFVIGTQHHSQNTDFASERTRITDSFLSHGLHENADFSYEPLTSHGTYGWEARLLCVENNYRSLIDKFIPTLVEAGARIISSCGLHVHLDMRHRDPLSCYKALLDKQEMLFSMCAASRQRNTYCPRNSPYVTGGSVISWSGADLPYTSKHSAIYTGAYGNHKTLEVRMHEAVLDAEVLTNWVTTLHDIVKPFDLTAVTAEQLHLIDPLPARN